MGYTRVFESEEDFNREIRTLFKNQEHQLPIRIFHDCQAILEMPFTSKVASNEVFLAACIENPKEKLSVDFDAVAKLFGLSKGGAQNKFRAIMNANKDLETVPSTPKSTKRKASQTADDGGTTNGDSKPAGKKTKSVDKGKGKEMDTVMIATDAPVSPKATPVVATDTPVKLRGEVDGPRTEAAGASTSHEAIPVAATISVEENPSGTTFDGTANKSSNPVTKKGVARKVKKAVAFKDDIRDAESDLPGGETDASEAEVDSSLIMSHEDMQVFKDASNYL